MSVVAEMQGAGERVRTVPEPPLPESAIRMAAEFGRRWAAAGLHAAHWEMYEVQEAFEAGYDEMNNQRNEAKQ